MKADSKKSNGSVSKGATGFEQFFAQTYSERWPALREALLTPPEKVALENPFGKYQEYSLDAASLEPVRALEIQRGERVADFCASPGGKLLAAIFAVQGEAEFVANDLSVGRVARLKAVLHDCLPDEMVQRVKVYQSDAGRWGQRFPESFDKILLDAPCSGERHLLGSKKELERWSAKGSQRLSVRQHALLCSALDSLRPGGRLVYSTCSISLYENDAVVDKLFKSRADQFDVIKPALAGEETQWGRIILPDVSGSGPIYYAVIVKH